MTEKGDTPKKTKRAPVAPNPRAEDERLARLGRKKDKPIPHVPGEDRNEMFTPRAEHKRKGRLPSKNRDAKKEAKSAKHAEDFIIPDCLFPKLNKNILRLEQKGFRRRDDYMPEFCDYVITWSSHGKSKVWIAAELRTTIQIFDAWMKRHSDLAEAFELGKLLAQRYWEDNGEQGMRERQFSAAIWKTIISSRFPADWQDNKKVELGLDTSFLGLWDAVSKGAAVVVTDETADETADDSSTPEGEK